MTAEEIKQNWERLLECIDTEISGERKKQLTEFYTHYEDRISMMPASSFEHFHNCFPGGYVDHVLRVVECAIELYEVWNRMGANSTDYTREELVFAAINHDLGKIGTSEGAQYLPNPSEWHRKNQGKIYTNNPEIPFMMVPDRTIFLLQDWGIKMSHNEYMGIKLHDGVFDDSNKPYFKASMKDSKMTSHMPILLHHADHMASRIEYEKWAIDGGQVSKPATSTRATKNRALSTDAAASAKDAFKSLFGDDS
jgi:hypothetical protein